MSSITQSTASTFDQALNNAIHLARNDYPWTDAQINWKVINISGQSGGDAEGLEDKVTIRIAHGLTRAYLEAQAMELEAELAA